MADIDKDRLAAILDAGQAAQSLALALGHEADELRGALHRARLAAEHGRRLVTDKGGVVVKEFAPEAQAKVDALEAQYARFAARREAQAAELSQAVDLARRCYEYAREHKLQVGRYDF